LGGEIKSLDDLPEKDFRRFSPRFFPENFDANLELVRKVEVLAQKKGCTTSQIAISWLLSLSKRPGMPKIIPIPGSTNPERIKQNSTVVDLSADDLIEIDEILKQFTPKGDRYPSFHATFLDG
jgi:pyridoxine 4-dehydrogenase